MIDGVIDRHFFATRSFYRGVAIYLLIGIFCAFFAHSGLAATQLNNVTARTIAGGNVELALQFSAPILVPKSFETEVPPRIILDFKDIESQVEPLKKAVKMGVLNRYEVSQSGQRLRVLLELKERVDYETRVAGNSLYVTLKGRSPTVNRVYKQRYAANPWVKTKHQVSKVDFRRDQGGSGRIIVDLSDAKMGITVDKRSRDIVVEFIDTGLPKQLQRRLDVTDFGTPVDYIATKQVGANTQMVISTHGNFDQLAYQINNQFIVDVSKQASTSVLPELYLGYGYALV